MEAKFKFETIASQYERLYGKYHVAHLDALINLGYVHKALGDYAQSSLIFELVIEGHQSKEGETSVNYALAKWIAASTLREKGDYNKAD